MMSLLGRRFIGYSSRLRPRLFADRIDIFWSPCAFIHHHKELEDKYNTAETKMRLYTGIIKSNPHRANRNTHTNEARFRRLRARKTIRIELPDDYEARERSQQMSPQEQRLEMLRRGMNPYKEYGLSTRSWNESQIRHTSFGYVPAEIEPVKDGESWFRMSWKNEIKRHWSNFRVPQRIRRKVPSDADDELKNFRSKDVDALNIYRDAHRALADRDRERLSGLVTEYAFSLMWKDVETTSIIWDLVEEVEPTRVHLAYMDEEPKDNSIAQITFRMHTLQVNIISVRDQKAYNTEHQMLMPFPRKVLRLAIFDRFGKLVLGSEEVLKKVLEYVVFECHIAQQGSKWLLHAKSNPQWFEPKSPSTITFRVHDDDDQPRKAIGAGRQKINLIK